MKRDESGQKNARIIAQYRDKYRARCRGKEYWAEVTGKIRYSSDSVLDFPVVGDNVNVIITGDDEAIITEILPRKSILKRKAAGKNEAQPIAVNVDAAFVVQSVDRDFNLNRFERYLTIIQSEKIKPVFVLNKTDLISGEELSEKVSLVKGRFKLIPLLTTNITNESGIDGLVQNIKKDKIYCLLGSSGVGKTSLINKLLGEELLKTKEISASTKKGKHTTTHRELFVLKNGGMIIDNPGMREIGLTETGKGLENVFNEIRHLSKHCKFSDCTHKHENGCAVLAAVESGELSKDKYANYVKLKKEADHYSMSRLEKKRKDRAFGRMVKSFMKLKKKNR